MQEKMRVRNLMIYILLVLFIITGSGMGLDAKQQVFSLRNHERTSTITAQSLTSNNDLHTFEVRENSSIIFHLKGLRDNRSDFSYRYGLFFCILAFLSVISQLSKDTFVLHSKRYVLERHYNIVFMQDIDGRKRIS